MPPSPPISPAAGVAASGPTAHFGPPTTHHPRCPAYSPFAILPSSSLLLPLLLTLQVDVADVDAAKYDDAYFKSAEKKAAKQSEEGFFAEQTEKTPLPAEYVANQKAVDAALLGKLRCVRVCGRGWVVGRCWRQACAAAGLMAAVEGGSMKTNIGNGNCCGWCGSSCEGSVT